VVGLSDRMNAKSSDLSTGLRQKMNIVRGFMTDPDVLSWMNPPWDWMWVHRAKFDTSFVLGLITTHLAPYY